MEGGIAEYAVEGVKEARLGAQPGREAAAVHQMIFDISAAGQPRRPQHILRSVYPDHLSCPIAFTDLLGDDSRQLSRSTPNV